MATGTKLFDQEGVQIFPETDASVTISNILKSGGNVEDCLKDLYDKITDLSGEGESAKNIKVSVGYLTLDTKDESVVEELTGWGAFELPTSDLPYTWKRTAYSYDKLELTVTHEIVSVYQQNEEQTIYKAMDSDTEQPKIEYQEDEEGNFDYQNVDFTSQGWSNIPISISASSPYVYMATRKKTDGLWSPFSTPVLYGKWAFDSVMEIRYTITDSSTPPELNSEATNPGDHWKETNNEEFTGYLWIITATSVNGVLNAKNKVIWYGPNLMSVVK